jgi:hypothetical protein
MGRVTFQCGGVIDMQIIKRIRSDGDNVKSAVYEIEQRLSNRILGAFPEGWEADRITGSVLTDLQALFENKRLHVHGDVLRSKWSVYGLTDETSRRFGTAAFLIKMRYHDGQEVEGVAYVDAQAKDPGRNTFSALRMDHTRRLSSAAPHAQLLLYDYDVIAGMALPVQPEALVGSSPVGWDYWAPYTHGAVVPAHLALSLGIRDTGLYKVGLPFSYQLCYRYLFGLDLDYSRPSVEIVRGLRAQKGRPKFVALVSVTRGGSAPGGDFNVNLEGYSRL